MDNGRIGMPEVSAMTVKQVKLIIRKVFPE